MDTFLLKIKRTGGEYDSFEVKVREGMTVLEALFYVQERLDPTLSFRYSCRGAVCGACAMLINKFPCLACRTQVSALLEGKDDPELKPYPAITGGMNWDASAEVLVEPLPHLPVLKDLVVDMEAFFRAYKEIEPYFRPVDANPEMERAMGSDTVRHLEDYTNCILCGCCYGACPVEGEGSPFLGPAAMAKLYRFIADPREGRKQERLELGDRGDGWRACKFHINCMKVCPKGVTPNMAIGTARAELG